MLDKSLLAAAGGAAELAPGKLGPVSMKGESMVPASKSMINSTFLMTSGLNSVFCDCGSSSENCGAARLLIVAGNAVVRFSVVWFNNVQDPAQVRGRMTVMQLNLSALCVCRVYAST